MFWIQKPENFHSDIEVVGMYIECKGKLLFLLRHESRVQPNKWCVPGGKVDPGETLLQAAVRELYEETGIMVGEVDLHFAFTIYKSMPENGLQLTFHGYSLKLTEFPTVTVAAGEHTEFAWLTPEESFQKELIPDEKEYIQMLYAV